MSGIPNSVVVLLIILGCAAVTVVGYSVHRLISPHDFVENQPNADHAIEQREYYQRVTNRYWRQIAREHGFKLGTNRPPLQDRATTETSTATATH